MKPQRPYVNPFDEQPPHPAAWLALAMLGAMLMFWLWAAVVP